MADEEKDVAKQTCRQTDSETPSPQPAPDTITHEKGTPTDVEAQESTTTTRETEKPYTTFSTCEKWFIVGIASAAAFFSPLSAQIYYPVLPVLTEKYHLTPSLINISVTTYMIFQGLAPSIMGTFSDASGRRPAYVIAFTIYLGANIGLALQNSYAALLVLRCLQSTGSSGTVSFGYAVVADVVTTSERGKFMGPMAAGVMVGPALGPVIGGLLAQFLGWRSVFWFLVIVCASFLVVYILFQPETHRRIVGDGSVMPLDSWRLSLVQFITMRRKVARMSDEDRSEYRQRQLELKAQNGKKTWFPNPLDSFLIVLQKDAFMIVTYSGLMMFGNLVLMTSTPTLFPKIYGVNELQVGLCFLPLGISAAIGAIINGKILDKAYSHIAKKRGLPVTQNRSENLTNFPIEQARLQTAFISAAIQALLFLPYGWALQYHAHLAVPLVIQFLIGFCMVSTLNSLSTLLADIFSGQVATASAAQNLLRCLLGAVGSAVVDSMLTGMGVGWCFTFTGLMLIAALGLLLVELKWGMGWRQERWQKNAEKEMAKEAERDEREQNEKAA